MVPITFVALLDNITEALNKRPKIINGKKKMIRDFIVILILYKNSFSERGKIGSRNTMARIIKTNRNGILRNIFSS